MIKLKHSMWVCNKQELCGRSGHECEHAIPHKVVDDGCNTEDYDCTHIQVALPENYDDIPEEDWPPPVWCMCEKVDFDNVRR